MRRGEAAVLPPDEARRPGAGCARHPRFTHRRTRGPALPRRDHAARDRRAGRALLAAPHEVAHVGPAQVGATTTVDHIAGLTVARVDPVAATAAQETVAVQPAPDDVGTRPPPYAVRRTA